MTTPPPEPMSIRPAAPWRREAAHESRDPRPPIQCPCAWQEPTTGTCKCGHNTDDHDAGECWAPITIRQAIAYAMHGNRDATP